MAAEVAQKAWDSTLQADDRENTLAPEEYTGKEPVVLEGLDGSL